MGAFLESGCSIVERRHFFFVQRRRWQSQSQKYLQQQPYQRTHNAKERKKNFYFAHYTHRVVVCLHDFTHKITRIQRKMHTPMLHKTIHIIQREIPLSIIIIARYLCEKVVVFFLLNSSCSIFFRIQRESNCITYREIAARILSFSSKKFRLSKTSKKIISFYANVDHFLTNPQIERN